MRNVFEFEGQLSGRADAEVVAFIAGGADDEKTLAVNRSAFDHLRIRARRLIDVSQVDTRIELLGEPASVPLLLAPVGFQQFLHPDGELATSRAAASRHVPMVASTVSSRPIEAITVAGSRPVWFQLYPTADRRITEALVRRADQAGCPVIVVTTDVPVVGNRESHDPFLRRALSAPEEYMGNFAGIGLPAQGLADPTLTWDIIAWLRARTEMQIVIKGIVTHEDARLCVEHGADAVIVSNHGGRQEESNRATIDSLPEVVEAIDGRIPVLIDGGFRRGTDLFKALAIGAQAVLIGRPFVWGLGVEGQAGVERVIDLLRDELVRIMQLAGTPSIAAISGAHIERAWPATGRR